MTFRNLDALLAIIAIGGGIASVGTVYYGLQLMTPEKVTPQNAVPQGATIYGHENPKYVVVGPHATHAECALEICPKLGSGASLACVKSGAKNRFIGYGWIGLYQDLEADGAKIGWDSWTSGCDSSLQKWQEGQPKWDGGSPERCAFATFHMKEDASSESESEFGGGIFSAPCWSKRPCICEYGYRTTEEYSSVADAMIAEKTSWNAWQKENKNMIHALLLCLCVLTQVCCCGILGMIAQYKKALVPADLETGKKADEAPEKVAEVISEEEEFERKSSKGSYWEGYWEAPAKIATDPPAQDKEASPPTGEEADAQLETAGRDQPDDRETTVDADAMPVAGDRPDASGAPVPKVTTLATPVSLDQIMTTGVADAPAPRGWSNLFHCYQEPCCYESTESTFEQRVKVQSDQALFQ